MWHIQIPTSCVAENNWKTLSVKQPVLQWGYMTLVIRFGTEVKLQLHLPSGALIPWCICSIVWHYKSGFNASRYVELITFQLRADCNKTCHWKFREKPKNTIYPIQPIHQVIFMICLCMSYCNRWKSDSWCCLDSSLVSRMSIYMHMHTSWYILPVLRICPISKMIQTTPKLWPKFTRYTCRCLQGRHVGSFKTTLQGPWSNHWHDEKIYIVVNKLINRSIWYKNWKYKI